MILPLETPIFDWKRVIFGLFRPKNVVFNQKVTYLIENDIINRKVDREMTFLTEKWPFWPKNDQFWPRNDVFTEKWRFNLKMTIFYQQGTYFDREITFLIEKWPILTEKLRFQQKMTAFNDYFSEKESKIYQRKS